MPYAAGEPQDSYCLDRCKCRCGYSRARELDGWKVPPLGPGEWDRVYSPGSDVEYSRGGYPNAPPSLPGDHALPRRFIEDGVIIEGPEAP